MPVEDWQLEVFNNSKKANMTSIFGYPLVPTSPYQIVAKRGALILVGFGDTEEEARADVELNINGYELYARQGKAWLS